jgi:hypothetical protein
MRASEFLENIFTCPTLMGRISEPPILVPTVSAAQPSVVLKLENYRFPTVTIHSPRYGNFYSYHFLMMNFQLNIPINDNFIFTKESKFGGGWRFISYNPEQIKNLSLDESIKIIRQNARMESESESGLLNHLNSVKMASYLKYLTMKIKEKIGNMIYSARIYYPLKVNVSKEKGATDILITSFTDANKLRLDMFFTIANAIADEISGYKSSF